MSSEIIEYSNPLLKNITDILQTERPDDWQDLTEKMIRGIYAFIHEKDESFWDFLDENSDINTLLTKERKDDLGKDSNGDPRTLLSATRKIIESYRV